MLFVIKLSPEITIKSRPVRRRLIRVLRRNLRRLLAEIDPAVQVRGEWDSLEVESGLDARDAGTAFVDQLARIPGIAQFQQVEKFPLSGFTDIVETSLRFYGPRLVGKSFAVRCKRSGQHDFRSIDVEREVGAGLLQRAHTAGVNLTVPEVTVQLEVRDDNYYVVEAQYAGLGGFPLGAQDGVLSLVSGGFDSAVSSFQCIRRGLLTHYLFFNLGGRAHELAVKEMALFLWMKYSASHRVKFVTVPFEGIVEDILTKVDDSQMGVVLKRTMLRAADRIADRMHVAALVTGESIAQVSSQTLANLALIDSVSRKLVLRPLITSDKQDIINQARCIGTEEFSRHIPEYCGVISVKPTTRARLERINREEGKLDPAILDQALAATRVQLITELGRELEDPAAAVEETGQLSALDLLIDIRHPEVADTAVPLFGEPPKELARVPFYRLSSHLADHDRNGRILLYCDRGMMSRLHAAHLKDQGFTNVAVYNPPRG